MPKTKAQADVPTQLYIQIGAMVRARHIVDELKQIIQMLPQLADEIDAIFADTIGSAAARRMAAKTTRRTVKRKARVQEFVVRRARTAIAKPRRGRPRLVPQPVPARPKLHHTQTPEWRAGNAARSKARWAALSKAERKRRAAAAAKRLAEWRARKSA